MPWFVTVGIVGSEAATTFSVDAPKDARPEMVMYSMGEAHAERLRSGETADRIRPPFTAVWVDDGPCLRTGCRTPGHYGDCGP